MKIRTWQWAQGVVAVSGFRGLTNRLAGRAACPQLVLCSWRSLIPIVHAWQSKQFDCRTTGLIKLETDDVRIKRWLGGSRKA